MVSGLRDEKNKERGMNMSEVLVTCAISINFLCLRAAQMKTRQYAFYSVVS